MPERIMIIAGESSGELYGALLAEALKAEFPGVKITGIGGVRMKAAGVELIAGITSAFGGIEALKVFSELKKTFNKVVLSLATDPPQILVLIDYPDFNLKLAARARKLGIPVFYYVSPQIWAWRKGRIKTIKRLVDMMAVALPFEEDIYKKAGVPCRFVGHPVMDEIEQELSSYDAGISDIGSTSLKSKVRAELGIETGRKVVAVMPGSRAHEIESLLPVIRQVIESMKERYPDYGFVLPVAPNLDESIFVRHPLPKGCHILKGASIKALLAADLAVIASGTATFQAALLGVPMVIIYKLSALSFFIAKNMVTLKYISLANLLLEWSVSEDSGLRICELVQEKVKRDNIMAEVTRIIDDDRYREEYLLQLDRVRDLFIGKATSHTVARMIGGMN
jgi:lipid-A-disaccharide synthase